MKNLQNMPSSYPFVMKYLTKKCVFALRGQKVL